MRLRTLDAHAGGGPLRLVVEGAPVVLGASMLDKRDWAIRHADWLRRSLLFEPRGHAAMCGAVLTEPTTPGAHAGVLFMDATGWTTLSGHGITALTTICLRERLVVPGGDGRTVVFDTPAGRVSAIADGQSFEQVSFRCPPSFVLHGGVSVRLASRTVMADVAFGGCFYAIVDSEAAGLPAGTSHLPEIGRRGIEIKRAIESSVSVVHSLEPRLKGIDGVLFMGPARSVAADFRVVAIAANGQADRSPAGLGAAALVAVLDAMGLSNEGGAIRLEGPIGTSVVARIAARTLVGSIEAVVPEIEGAAWITGEHTFLVEGGDPFREGFTI